MIYTATSDWLSIIGLTKKHDDMTKLTNHTKTALQRHIVSSTENLKDYELVAKAEKNIWLWIANKMSTFTIFNYLHIANVNGE